MKIDFRSLRGWRPPNPWKLTPALILVIVVSLVISGLILQWADEDQEDVLVSAGLNEPAFIAPGQSFTVTSIRSSTSHRNEGALNETRTPGVFVVFRFTMATQMKKTIRAVNCSAVQGGRKIDLLQDNIIVFPEPGFERIMENAIEFPADVEKIKGTHLYCKPSDEIDAVTNKIDIDLGLTEEHVKILLENPGRSIAMLTRTRPIP